MNSTSKPPRPRRATKAVVLARVSTEEQEDGYSLDAQINRLTGYCERTNLQVLETFQITESSTKGDREKFFRMVKTAEKYAKQLKEPIAVVADKIDRAQRSFNEMPVLDGLRKKGIIELHFNTDNCVIHQDSPANEIFMWNISIALAQNYTDSLRDNIKRSIVQKLKQGEWISQAPIGYILDRKEGDQKNDIILDPDRSHLVRKLFEIYSTGEYSYQAMVKVAEKIGLNNARGKKKGLARAHIYNILADPFYYGVMHVKSRGEFYPHRYETIISKELFDRCEDVRMGRKRYVGDYDSIEFLFKGMLTCAVTDRKVTSERKRKKKANGEQMEWIYLRTQNPDNLDKHIWVREEEVIAQIDDALKSLALPNAEVLQELLTYLYKTHGSKKHAHRMESKELKAEHGDIQDRLDKLVDLMIEGRIADEDYQKKHRALKKQQIEIMNKLRSLDAVDGQFAKQMDYLIKVAHGSANIFAGSENSEKRELLKMIFQNLQLRGKKLEYTMASPFDEFAKCTEIAEWWAR